VFAPADQGGDDALDSDADTGTGRTPAVTLNSGDAPNTTLDAGLYQAAGLGDRVWIDINANGIQDAGEPGLDGVTVNLLDGSGNPTGQTTMTSGGGAYAFTGLTPADYSVQFVLPTGYAFTVQDQGANDGADSDADPTTGNAALTTLSSGENDLTWDAGLYSTTTGLGDFVWDDYNANGIQDSGEPGIDGVTVNLLDGSGNPIGQTTTTSGGGGYAFTNLTPGSYIVEFVLPTGYVFASPNQGADDALDSDADPTTGRTAAVTLASGDNDISVDAGMYSTGTRLGDFVWTDVNANGVQDSGEPGIDGVTVNLLDGSGNPTGQTTTTSSGGAYAFTGLTPGSYIVEFVLPSGYTFAPQDQGADDALDSDADVTTGRTAAVTLASGENNTTLDAGMFSTTTGLGDFVWNDLDRDGVQDLGESGIDGVTVNLLDGSGNPTGQTTTTAGGGRYAFTNLTPGDYIVEFVPPAGYLVSPQDQGADDSLDSDGDPTTGQTAVTNLVSDENDLSWDMGLYQVTTGLGDFVWDDANRNGVQDAGENGIPNVTVNLLDESGAQVATTTTSATGFYQFTNLAPGTYQIEIVLPSGYTFSPADQGDDALDSDVDPATRRIPPVTLTDGQYELNTDAGMYLATTGIGDLVWEDTNGNGIQDDGELGVPGVTVNLLDTAGNQLQSTVTDEGGLYRFTELAPGEYQVQFVLPSGYEFGPQDTIDDALDSDVDPATSLTATLTLEAGVFDATVDAALIPTATEPTEPSTETTQPEAVDPVLLYFDPAISKIGIIEQGGLGLPGERLIWQVTIKNVGNTAGTDLVVSDTLRSELQIESAEIAFGTVSVDGQTVTFSIPKLDAGETVMARIDTIVLTSPSNGVLDNQVTLSGKGPNGEVNQRAASAQVEVMTQLPSTGYPPAKSDEGTSLLDSWWWGVGAALGALGVAVIIWRRGILPG
jgi:uncharacterized repeat protein (TIGR01451 family)